MFHLFIFSSHGRVCFVSSVKNIVRSQAVFGLALPVSFLSANKYLDVVLQYDANVKCESLHVVNLSYQQEMALVSNGF